jgi:NADH-quinone oxidoreductase subunit J
MVIIYGGAILVTYVFVIMLAAQAGGQAAAEGQDPQTSPLYDREAREPAAAVIVGFLLLAVLLSIQSQLQALIKFII